MSPEPAAEPPVDHFVKDAPVAADFSDDRLSRLLDWWTAARGGHPQPPVAAIDPLALKFLLGWLMIIEPIDGGADFRYRLYGSQIANLMGRDLTGRRISDSFPSFSAFANPVYRRALERPQAILTRHRSPSIIVVSAWERLILPFGEPDGRIDRFLVGAVALGYRMVEQQRLPWPLTDSRFD